MSNALVPFGIRMSLFDDLRKEMDSIFSRYLPGENGSESTQLSSWTPRLNLAETDSEYHVSVDLPGLTPEQVNVELRHGDLWITGQREEESEQSGKTWHRIERHFGQFRRVVRLGDDVDVERVDASYKDGVLHIIVPKTESAQTKRIEIKC